MSSRLSPEERNNFRALADALLPAHGAMPSASAVDVADSTLDHLIGLRADLLPDLLRGLRTINAEESADSAIERLSDADSDALCAIRLFALAGYYQHPRVRQLIGYPGQESHEPDIQDPPPYVASGLLAPVLQRGPIWRPAPHTETATPSRSNPMKQQHVLVVFSNPVDGREADYNEWQDNIHVPEVLSIPGFVSAQRYKLSDAQFLPSDTRPPYITLYQIETDDLESVYAEAGKRMQTLNFTDALQMETFSTHSFAPVGKAHRTV